eukprot:COSAG03_NODE_195_length_10851_cov_4.693080_3_plen_127_part_00
MYSWILDQSLAAYLSNMLFDLTTVGMCFEGRKRTDWCGAARMVAIHYPGRASTVGEGAWSARTLLLDARQLAWRSANHALMRDAMREPRARQGKVERRGLKRSDLLAPSLTHHFISWAEPMHSGCD